MSRAINPTISKRQVGFVSSFGLFERFLVSWKSRTTDRLTTWNRTSLHSLYLIVYSSKQRSTDKQQAYSFKTRRSRYKDYGDAASKGIDEDRSVTLISELDRKIDTTLLDISHVRTRKLAAISWQ
jgi:hypothetical protein